MRELFPHVVLQRIIEPFDNRGLHYGIHRIMVDVAFLQEFMHIRVVKFFPSISMQIFRTSSIISNYLCDRLRHLVSVLGFEWFGPYMFIQHVNNYENVVVTSIESHIRTHRFDHIRLPQVVFLYYDVPSQKISSRRSVQFNQSVAVSKILRIIIRHNALLKSYF